MQNISIHVSPILADLKKIIKDIKNKLTARGFERRTSELAATERANHSAKFSDENRKNLNTESMDMLIS